MFNENDHRVMSCCELWLEKFYSTIEVIETLHLIISLTKPNINIVGQFLPDVKIFFANNFRLRVPDSMLSISKNLNRGIDYMNNYVLSNNIKR